jgi:hypothetical protein
MNLTPEKIDEAIESYRKGTNFLFSGKPTLDDQSCDGIVWYFRNWKTNSNHRGRIHEGSNTKQTKQKANKQSILFVC